MEAELFWGPTPGVKGGKVPFSFELRVALHDDLQDLCPLVCSNHGTCVEGVCECFGAQLHDTLRYVGEHCAKVAEVLEVYPSLLHNPWQPCWGMRRWLTCRGVRDS